MKISRCLICYEQNSENENAHRKCIKKLFKTNEMPSLDYSLNQMEELAKTIVNERLTVTGVQKKLSLNLEKSKSKARLTIINLWGEFILKPPTIEYPYMIELEDLTMHLAKICNINTAEHSLIRLKSGELAYICKRFDRNNKEKLHVEDMCQLTENLTIAKYTSSMEKIGKVVLKYCTNSGFDAIRLFELTLFSYITGNSDMHLKNFSLLNQNNNTISLSPAYDLLPTKLLIKDDNEDLALTLNGKKSNFKSDDFLKFAKALYINEKACQKILLNLKNKQKEMKNFIKKSFIPPHFQNEFIELISEKLNRI